MKRLLIIVGLGLSLLACSRIAKEQDIDKSDCEEICFTAYLNDARDVETKTERQEEADGNGNYPVYWSPGDAVSLFFIKGEKGGSRFVAQNTTVAPIAEFRGTITGFAGGGESAGGEFWFWGVYPYSEENSCDGSSITTVLSTEQTAKVGSFADGLFPTMARAKGLELAFYNIGTGLKFRVSRSDIKTIKFRGNANEDIAGKAKIIWDEQGRPAVSEFLDGKKEVSVSAPDGGTFIPEQWYYLVFFPCAFSRGFTMTCITTDSKQGCFTYTGQFPCRRGIFKEGNYPDQKVTTWTDAEEPTNPSGGTEGGTESGLYFGITGFNNSLSSFPIGLLTPSTMQSFYDFLDGLAMKNGTILYYSVNDAIDKLQSTACPNDLNKVALITFTDGLDRGSPMMVDNYPGNDMYLSHIQERILNDKVSGLPLTAWSVGFYGNDVDDYPQFDRNLSNIASSSSNAKRVTSMDEVNRSFQEIAENLNVINYLQNLVVEVPGEENGTRIRIVLDGASSASNSKKYIEGIFELSSRSLTSITYLGITSTSGSTVRGSVKENVMVSFAFDNISNDDGVLVKKEDIKEYLFQNNKWVPNSEDVKAEEPILIKEKHSAIVLLNLDCSTSLGDDFPVLKTHVKAFISKLCEAAFDPNAISSVSLNKTEMDLNVGQSETFQVTVSPSTASASSLIWESAIPSVATVDQNGTVTAVSEGTTIITVKAEDGKALASCTVRVRFQHVESISLNKSSLSMYVGKTETLYATFTPSDASEPAVTWSSSNPSVATVSNNGVVTALAFGTSTIQVKTVDGEKTASCNVTVKEYTPSSEPLDLSLAVWSSKTSSRGYIPYDEYNYANWDELQVEGLTVLSISGNLIIALEDASSNGMCYEAASLFYRLPNQSQGVSISARFAEINAALSKWGGSQISYNISHWTSTMSSNGYHYCIYGSGGSLITSGDSNQYYVRLIKGTF